MKVILFIAVLLGLGQNLWAINTFPDSSVVYAREAGDGAFEDPYIYSVWGSRRNLVFKENPGNVKRGKVTSEHFYKGELIYRFGKARKVKGKAPLMIYLPGIFSRLISVQNNRMLKTFRKEGLHTLVFPNPLATDFIKQGPKYQAGNPLVEAEVIYQAIRDLVAKFNQDEILNGEIHLAGVSYGGFLSAVIAGLDASHEKPIITGNVTVISPPYNFLASMKRLDELAESTEEEYASSGLLRVLKRSLAIFGLDGRGEVNEDHLWDSRGIVAHFVFKEGFIKALRRYNKFNNQLNIPRKRKEYEKWYNEMTFSGYYKKYAFDSYQELDSAKGVIDYWMDLYNRNTGKFVRVVTAKDDFLNDESGRDWDRYSLDQVVVLENGGHFGFRKEEWFDKFLREIYL